MTQRSVRLKAIEARGRDADEKWISAYLVMPQRTVRLYAIVAIGRDASMSMDVYAWT